MVKGLRALRRILAAPALAPFIEAEHDPGPACASDDELLDFARRKGSTVYHPTSTCRMGDDPTAVVDARLEVRGFERLRVVDASIMPTLVSGNTNAAGDHDRREGVETHRLLAAPSAASAIDHCPPPQPSSSTSRLSRARRARRHLTRGCATFPTLSRRAFESAACSVWYSFCSSTPRTGG